MARTEGVIVRWLRPLMAVVDAANRRGKAVGVRLVKSLYVRLNRWKRDVALARRTESTGFCIVARVRP